MKTKKNTNYNPDQKEEFLKQFRIQMKEFNLMKENQRNTREEPNEKELTYSHFY